MESSRPASNGINPLDHQGSRHDEKVCSVTLQELSQLLNSQQRKWSNGSRPRRQIHKVPLLLRLKGQSSKRVYEPVVLSLGPYHHGRPALRQAEEFKYLCLDRCVSSSGEKKVLFFNKILEMIDEIRGCYAEVSIVDKYDDKTLALMMLLDACFILNFMENNSFTERNNFQEWHNCLGVAATTRFVARDIMVLENQIPFQVLNLLIRLQYDKKEADELYWRFLNWMMSLELERSETFVDDEEPPLHILEICRRVIVNQPNTDLNHQ